MNRQLPRLGPLSRNCSKLSWQRPPAVALLRLLVSFPKPLTVLLTAPRLPVERLFPRGHRRQASPTCQLEAVAQHRHVQSRAPTAPQPRASRHPLLLTLASHPSPRRPPPEALDLTFRTIPNQTTSPSPTNSPVECHGHHVVIPWLLPSPSFQDLLTAVARVILLKPKSDHGTSLFRSLQAPHHTPSRSQHHPNSLQGPASMGPVPSFPSPPPPLTGPLTVPPGPVLPQGLCTGCTLCLECFPMAPSLSSVMT